MPGLLARLLADPENGAVAGRACASALPHLLDRLEDGRAGDLLARAMPRLLSGETLAPVVARALRALVEGDRHQEVLSFLLFELKAVLRAKEESLRLMIEDRVREQGGRLIGWAIGGSIATRRDERHEPGARPHRSGQFGPARGLHGLGAPRDRPHRDRSRACARVGRRAARAVRTPERARLGPRYLAARATDDRGRPGAPGRLGRTSGSPTRCPGWGRC